MSLAWRRKYQKILPSSHPKSHFGPTFLSPWVSRRIFGSWLWGSYPRYDDNTGSFVILVVDRLVIFKPQIMLSYLGYLSYWKDRTKLLSLHQIFRFLTILRISKTLNVCSMCKHTYERYKTNKAMLLGCMYNYKNGTLSSSQASLYTDYRCGKAFHKPFHHCLLKH